MQGRWGFVVRVAAIGLLLLAVSPVTAPFSTLDLAPPGASSPLDGSTLKLKPSSDGTSVTRADLPEPALLDRIAGRATTPPNLTERQRLEQRVLRI